MGRDKFQRHMQLNEHKFLFLLQSLVQLYLSVSLHSQSWIPAQPEPSKCEAADGRFDFHLADSSEPTASQRFQIASPPAITSQHASFSAS